MSHSFISNLIANRYNSQINDDFFKEKEGTPSNVDYFSPDFAGTLFPKEINASNVQLQCFEKLYKKYRDYSNVKSSRILIDESIAPSPDSGFYSSTQTSKSNLSLMSDHRNSFLLCHTPPSHFKWNRKEYRSGGYDMISSIDESANKSEEELEIDDEYIPNWDLESTQIYGNGTRLADNRAMRRFSSIGPLQLDDDENERCAKKRPWESIDNFDVSLSSILRNSELADDDSDNDGDQEPSCKSSRQQNAGVITSECLSNSNWQHLEFGGESDLNGLSPIRQCVDFGGSRFRSLPDFDLSPIKPDGPGDFM